MTDARASSQDERTRRTDAFVDDPPQHARGHGMPSERPCGHTPTPVRLVTAAGRSLKRWTAPGRHRLVEVCE